MQNRECRRSRSLLSLTLPAALCAVIAQAEPGDAPVVEATDAIGALRLEAPADGERLRRSVPWLLVRGRTRAELFDADVVIALDASNSALLSSGIDLDADGVVGVTRPWAQDAKRRLKRPPAWTTDADDAIVRAEVVAARALVDGLSLRRNRIGLLSYTALPREHASVGAPERVRLALDALHFPEDWTGTDVARALRHASRMLEAATPPGVEPRSRAVLLCSDGEPSVPAPDHHAKRRALREASRLADAGIPVYVLAFGEKLLREQDPEVLAFLEALARAGGGRLVVVATPATLLQDLPPAEPVPAKLEIANRRTGELARALHRRPDGSFDALLALAPGVNELEVRARWSGGRHEWVRRVVHYEEESSPGAEQRREDAELLSLLRARTRELGETPR